MERGEERSEERRGKYEEEWGERKRKSEKIKEIRARRETDTQLNIVESNVNPVAAAMPHAVTETARGEEESQRGVWKDCKGPYCTAEQANKSVRAPSNESLPFWHVRRRYTPLV